MFVKYDILVCIPKSGQILATISLKLRANIHSYYAEWFQVPIILKIMLVGP